MIGYYFTKDSAKIRLFFGFTKLFLFNYIFYGEQALLRLKESLDSGRDDNVYIVISAEP